MINPTAYLARSLCAIGEEVPIVLLQRAWILLPVREGTPLIVLLEATVVLLVGQKRVTVIRLK
jgi:hypothetical protein